MGGCLRSTRSFVKKDSLKNDHSAPPRGVFLCAKIDFMKVAEKKLMFNRTLFRWHRAHYREMPWRNTHDPYRILVSEIMLQQTQVDRVRMKYAEFLAKFPNVSALALAPLGAVLRVWSGLGYNRRARYLHECAKKVVHEYGGKFPADFDELNKLPGIGRSTAGALLAFSFGQDTPMIDTNIRRILVRVFFPKARVVTPRTALKHHSPRAVLGVGDKELYVFAQSLIPKGKGRMWNYAMLDLGATLCTARNHSADCPLLKLHGAVDDFIYKKPQKKFKDSNRFYRGKIMRLLTEHHALTVSSLAKYLGKTNEEIQVIVAGLRCEGLVTLTRGYVRLPR